MPRRISSVPMAAPLDVACLILAAGASSRFGSAKMLHSMSNGEPLLAQTISSYQAVFDKVWVVARAEHVAITELISHCGAYWLDSPLASQGLSQSVIAGVQATAPQVGWLIGLGDMPYVRSETIAELKENMSSEHIVQARSPNGDGNPIGFGIKFEQELLSLQGDVGAKAVVTKHRSERRTVLTSDTGIHRDVDRPSDLI